MSREHDIFYGPQRKPDGSIVMDFSYYTINGQSACVKCDEVWPCQAILSRGYEPQTPSYEFLGGK